MYEGYISFVQKLKLIIEYYAFDTVVLLLLIKVYSN